MDVIADVGRFLSDNKMVWERKISAQPERLWDAMSTKDGLSRWFMPTKYEHEGFWWARATGTPPPGAPRRAPG